MDIIELAVQKGLISFNEDKTTIKYTYQNVVRNYSNPEETVQAEAFCKLVMEYHYPVERINQFVKVTSGSTQKEADIIVYKDSNCLQPYIIVECKKGTVSEQEFQQAINQAFSYAHDLAGTIKYVWVTSGIKDEYFRFDKNSMVKETQPDIPKMGQTKVARYKYVKYDEDSVDVKFLDLKKVTEDELTNRFKQAHQALWGGGELNPSQAFDELDKLIFCKIWDERNCKLNSPYDFQKYSADVIEDDSEGTKRKKESEAIQQLAQRIHKLYEAGEKEDKEVFKEPLKLSPEKINTVVGYLQDVSLLKTDLDSKGRAFETLMGSFFRGDFGQFFTPRKIVSFMVDSLPIEKSSKVLDTSCGSGGFLLHALNKVREEAKSVGKEGTQANKDYWHEFARKRLYGIEINEQIARTAKMNMIIHDDGRTNVVSADGLLSPSDLRSKTNNPGFEENSFDFIITNPPFGSVIKQTEKAYFHQYHLAKKSIDWLNFSPSGKQTDRQSQNSEVLFIEQAERYLHDGGYLAIVIPDGILTNSSMQYIRDYIGEAFRIVAVVSLPQTAFIANGAGVKSSVLFLKKYSESEKQARIDVKDSIQHHLVNSSDDGNQLQLLLRNKKITTSKFANEMKQAEKEGELERIEELKEKRQQGIDKFDEEIERMKEELTGRFEDTYKSKLQDYPIFMAIAEDIGYDATGKETGTNELTAISKELLKFINAIENGTDHFFL